MRRLMVVMVLAAAVTAFGTDWPSGGSVTVPAGETYVATEADMAKVNALTSITIEGAVEGDEPKAAGVLVFDGCATAPKAGLLLGEGVVRKVGSQVWTLAGDNAAFNGDFRICGGKVITRTASAFGKTTSDCKGAVYVESGATLAFDSNAVKFNYRPLHIAGTGTGSTAADRALSMVTATTGCIGYLHLDADATVYLASGCSVYWIGTQGEPIGSGKGSEVHTHGFTLTKTGPQRWFFLGPKLQEGGRIVSAEGSEIDFSINGDYGSSEDEPFEIAPASSYAVFFKAVPPVYRPLQVDNVLSFGFNQNDSESYKQTAEYYPLLHTNLCNWAGPVSLYAPGALLTLAQNFTAYGKTPEGNPFCHDLQISFTGTVSGPGSLAVGSSGQTSCGRYALGGHNTYTGTTTVYGGQTARLYAYWHDSIPDYSKTTVNRGYVAARAGTDADGETEFWPREKMHEFREKATFLNGGAFAVDASGCPDERFTFTAKELLEDGKRPEIGLGVAGGTVRVTTEEEDKLPICPCAYRGTLELMGPGTFLTCGTNAIYNVSWLTNNDCAVAVRDGATVKQGDLPVFIGHAWPHESNATLPYITAPGRLTVRNAQWLTTSDVVAAAATDAALQTGALVVGANNPGILEIQDGGFVSNKVLIGNGRYSNANYAYGAGAVYVDDGGRLHMRGGGTQWNYCSGVGVTSYGYLQLGPGSQVSMSDGDISIGCYGYGVVHMYGGALTRATGLTLCRGNANPSADIYIKSGTFKLLTDTGYISTCQGAGSTSLVAVDGPDALIDGEGYALYPGLKSNTRTVICLNDGGTILLNRINPYAAATNGVERHPVVVTFNGGQIRRTSMYNNFVNTNPRALEFAIYEKGAVFDFGDSVTYTTGQTPTIDPVCPLAGRIKGGIKSIDASEALALDWIGAPRVRITGAGGGAAAVADWDWQNRKLKGIRILSPGWDYVQGEVSVELYTYTRTMTIDGDKVTVGDNEIGGLTKKGNGTFLIQSTNSWQKWTQIDGAGAIKVGGAYAIPANTELRLNGGTLDLNGYDADEERATTFCGVAGTGGTVKNGNLRIVGEWKVSAQRFLDRVTTAVAGTVDLTDCTGVTITDTELLDDEAAKGKTLNLMTASSIVLPEGGVAVDGLPGNWKASLTEGGLRMGPQKGLMLIFR